MSFFAPRPDSVKGANSVPPPRPDSAVNAPSPAQHQRVWDFVQEAPNARYTFDSRKEREGEDVQLCRHTPEGVSCVKSAALFKSMQTIGFYCALPAEPTRTHMECNHLPRA